VFVRRGDAERFIEEVQATNRNSRVQRPPGRVGRTAFVRAESVLVL